jgi:ELWxxDGT repeat protein
MRTLTFPALLLGLLFLSGVGPPPLYAQSSAEPVTALGPDDQIGVFGTYTEQFVATDDVLYFPVDEDGTGDELYTYDGSAVTRVSDFPDFTGPRWPTVYDDNLYFTVNGSEGNELYEYDGSSVQRITNINSSGGSSIAESVVYDGRLFFGADPDGGFSAGDLYAYDGSTITRVTNTGGDLNPSNFIVYDDGGGKTLYFNGTSSLAGTEIFEYDGSSVSLAVDVNNGADSSEPTAFAVYDGDLYFQAGTGSDGFRNRELYQTDGNSAQIVDEINDSGPSRPRNLTVYDDGNGAALYFTATDGDDTELHRWNGSDVAEIDVDGDPTNDSSPNDLVSAGGLLYFSATVNGENNLYQYDGGSGTVSQVADVNPSGGCKALRLGGLQQCSVLRGRRRRPLRALPDPLPGSGRVGVVRRGPD